jgi:CBS domain containing-hemolysin-like protein
MICGIVACDKCCLNLGIQTPHETTLLLCISVHILGCVLWQMIEFANILKNCLVSLFQREKLF